MPCACPLQVLVAGGSVVAAGLGVLPGTAAQGTVPSAAAALPVIFIIQIQ